MREYRFKYDINSHIIVISTCEASALAKAKARLFLKHGKDFQLELEE